MSNIKDHFSSIEQQKIEEEALKQQMEAEMKASESDSKSVTLRLDPYAVTIIDSIAKYHSMSRQALLSMVVTDGIRDVVSGTFEPYENSEELIQGFYDDARSSFQKSISSKGADQ